MIKKWTNTYYMNNRKKILEQQKKYYNEHKEEKIDYQKEYYMKNKELIKERKEQRKKDNFINVLSSMLEERKEINE